MHATQKMPNHARRTVQFKGLQPMGRPSNAPEVPFRQASSSLSPGASKRGQQQAARRSLASHGGLQRAHEGMAFGKSSKTPKQPDPDNVEIFADDAVSNVESDAQHADAGDKSPTKSTSLLSTPRMEHVIVRRPQRDKQTQAATKLSLE